MSEKRAFTLIELLIVVAIIAILAAIAVPNFLEAQVRAKVSRGKNDIRTMALALEAYAVDYSKYISGEGFTGYFKSVGDPNTMVWDYLAVLKPLTTPVAYMTALPVDNPFGNFKGGNWREMHGYEYDGGEFWVKAMNPMNKGDVDYRQYFPAEWADSQYIFMSMGPTKSFWSPYIPYDATNGTVSNGVIVRVGGGTTGFHSFK